MTHLRCNLNDWRRLATTTVTILSIHRKLNFINKLNKVFTIPVVGTHTADVVLVIVNITNL